MFGQSIPAFIPYDFVREDIKSLKDSKKEAQETEKYEPRTPDKKSMYSLHT